MLAAIVLVVTATAGFRHESIETAEQVITSIGERTRWFEPRFARVEDEIPRVIPPEVQVVMFVNTTGEIAPAARAALLAWVREGGTFVGVHSASDTWHESPEYIDMLGGEFDSHPAESLVAVQVDAPHAATHTLESRHPLFEEIYTFKNLGAFDQLLSVTDGRPLAWTKSYGRGRVFYTALGHRIDVWTSPWFQQHLTGALAWALGREAPARRRAAP